MTEAMEVPVPPEARQNKVERPVNHEYTEQVINNSLKRHEEFDKKWRKEHGESYHNKEHIKATLKTVDKLFDKAEQGIDPLNIAHDIEKWNEMKRKAYEETNADVEYEPITMEMAKDIFKQAFAEHDSGNIMLENGVSLTEYTAKGAEDRSKEIYHRRIYNLPESEMDHLTRDQYENLGTHVIEKTKVNFDLTGDEYDEPFWRLVAVIDQLGNRAETENEHSTDGLITEMSVENPEGTMSEYDFYNWDAIRSKKLIPDGKKRRQFYEEVLETDMPVINESFSKEKMTFPELLEYRMQKNPRLKIRHIIHTSPGGLSSQTEAKIERVIGDDEELRDWYQRGMRSWDEMTPENL